MKVYAIPQIWLANQGRFEVSFWAVNFSAQDTLVVMYIIRTLREAAMTSGNTKLVCVITISLNWEIVISVITHTAVAVGT